MKAAIEILTERMNREMELASLAKKADIPEEISHSSTAAKIKHAIEILQAKSRQADLPPCPCCGSEKTYLTEAMHCTRCAVTTEM